MKKGVGKIIGGGLLFLFGIAAPFGLFIPLFFQGDDVVLLAPGSKEITVEKPGRYYLWNNYRAVFEGRSYSSGKELPAGLTFTLAAKEGIGSQAPAPAEQPAGRTLPLHPDGSISASSGSGESVSIGYFEVVTPGSYLLEISGEAPQGVFTFGPTLLGNLPLFVGGLLLAILVSMASLAGAVVLVVLGIVQLACGPRPAPGDGPLGR